MREGDPAGVSVIELHGDQVPVVLKAQQACGRRGGVRGPKGSRDEPGSSPRSRMQEGGCAGGRMWASEPGGPGSTGSQSSQARGPVHSSRDPPQINEGSGTFQITFQHIPKCWTLSPEAGAVGYLMSEEPQVLV